MAALNFLDPYFFMRIADQNGNIRIFSSGAQGPEAEQPNLGRFLAGVTITEQIEGNAAIQAVLEPPRDLGHKLLDSTVLAAGNVVEVRWGYPSFGDLRQAFAINQLPDIAIGEEVQITVNAEGFLFGMQHTERHRVWRADPTNEASEALSPTKIVIELGKQFGFSEIEIDMDDDRFLQTPNMPFHQVETDWLFIRRLAKEYNAIAFLEGGTRIKIVGNEKSKSRRAVATFRMYGQLDTKNNVYPMTGFSTDQAGVIFGLPARGVRVRDIDPDEGPTGTLADGSEPQQVTKDDTTTKQPATDEAPAAGTPKQDIPAAGFPELTVLVDKQFKPELGDIGKNLPMSARKTNLDQIAQSEFDNGRLNVFEATAEVLGVPGLFPKDYVKIEGVGEEHFNRFYWCKQITHTLGTGGYDMSIQMVADGLGENSAFAVRPTERANQRVDESSESIAAKASGTN